MVCSHKGMIGSQMSRAPSRMRCEPADAVTQLSRERDLYLRLLELGQQDAIEPLLHEALTLVVQVTGAVPEPHDERLGTERSQPDVAPHPAHTGKAHRNGAGGGKRRRRAR